METIDTHEVELAFDSLMKELDKIKNLNDLIDSYKGNVDSLSKLIVELADEIKVFYDKAKERDEVVREQYSHYAKLTKELSELLDNKVLEFKKINRGNVVFHIILTVLGLVTCTGIAYMIFFA